MLQHVVGTLTVLAERAGSHDPKRLSLEIVVTRDLRNAIGPATAADPVVAQGEPCTKPYETDVGAEGRLVAGGFAEQPMQTEVARQ
jgi:hypothetical protein